MNLQLLDMCRPVFFLCQPVFWAIPIWAVHPFSSQPVLVLLYENTKSFPFLSQIKKNYLLSFLKMRMRKLICLVCVYLFFYLLLLYYFFALVKLHILGSYLKVNLAWIHSCLSFITELYLRNEILNAPLNS